MRLASFVVGALLAAGCSSSSGNGSTGDGGAEAADAGLSADAAPGDSALSDASSTHEASGDSAAACNTLANTAPTVTVQQVAQNPPQPQGGTPVDGTYTMTDVTVFTGPNGPTGASGSAQTTIQISGTTVQVVSTGSPATRTTTLATSGTSFTSTDTCPDKSVTHGSYTATSTTFVVFLDGGTDDAGARTLVETFTKS